MAKLVKKYKDYDNSVNVLELCGHKFTYPLSEKELLLYNINQSLNNLTFLIEQKYPHKNIDVQPALNLKIQMAELAANQSAEYIMKNLCHCPSFKTRFDILEKSLSEVKINDGLYIECGVYKGKSINFIASNIPDKIIYGFDSFEGLPEDWTNYYKKEHFSVKKLPKVKDNVKLIKGWFDTTLPKFAAEHANEKIAFLNCDADLYSSTKTILNLFKNNITSGTIIQFDEYFNYPNWQEHEFKAFQEFVKENNIDYEYIAYAYQAKQCAIRIL